MKLDIINYFNPILNILFALNVTGFRQQIHHFCGIIIGVYVQFKILGLISMQNTFFIYVQSSFSF